MVITQLLSRKIKSLFFIFLALISISAGVNYAFFNNPGSEIYYKVELDESKEANRIIKILNDRIIGGSDIFDLFMNPDIYESFIQLFEYEGKDYLTEFKVKSTDIKLEGGSLIAEVAFISKINKNITIPILFSLELDQVVNDYRILSFSTNRQLIDHYIEDIIKMRIYDQESIYASDCGSIKSTSYVRLKHKSQKGEIRESQPLGSNLRKNAEIVPEDFFNTDAVRQIPFPEREVGDEKYNAGYVISGKDTEAVGVGSLFGDILDADGSLYVYKGDNEVSLPFGVFIDGLTNRLVIITDGNQILRYGRREDQTMLYDPQSVKIIKNYLYVYDSYQDAILAFKINFSEKISLQYKGKILYKKQGDFVVDIAGFAGENQIQLFAVTDEKKIIKYRIDSNTGLPVAGSNSEFTFSEIKDIDNQNVSTGGGFTKIEVIPNSSDSESFTIVALQNNHQDVIVLKGKNNDAEDYLTLTRKVKFPGNSYLTNIGFNWGEKVFYVTDFNGKIHIISNEGDYLGSGGSRGKGEQNCEFYYPTIITSNFFAGDAVEVVIGSKWGKDTGFKRIMANSVRFVPVISVC